MFVSIDQSTEPTTHSGTVKVYREVHVSAWRTDWRISTFHDRKWAAFACYNQQSECVARGNMTRKVEIVAVLSICTVFITAFDTVAGFAARADDLGTAVYSGVNRLRQTCGVIGDDPRLTVAARRHANDMLKNGLDGHIGSDGSSPQARITDAGY
jgi:uncharacterized protein YkwD